MLTPEIINKLKKTQNFDQYKGESSRCGRHERGRRNFKKWSPLNKNVKFVKVGMWIKIVYSGKNLNV